MHKINSRLLFFDQIGVFLKDTEMVLTKKGSDSALSRIESPNNTNKLLNVLMPKSENNHYFLCTNDRNIPGSFRNIPVNRDIHSQIDELKKTDLDVYHACASFISPDNRTAANTVGARAFWFDVDIGLGKSISKKGYATTDKAREAQDSFCNQIALPPSNAVVNSGSGFHLYWLLNELIDKDIWKIAAKKLKALTIELGFYVDPSRTADIASVLRPPGTLNHKSSPPKPVELIHFNEQLIDADDMLNLIDKAYEKHCKTAEPKNHTTAKTITSNAVTDQNFRVDLERLQSAAPYIPPDCDDDEYKFKIIAPLARAARENPDIANQLKQIAHDISSGALRDTPSEKWVTPSQSNGKTGEASFDGIWDRFNLEVCPTNATSLGSFFHLAKQNGWKDLQIQETEIIPAESEGTIHPTSSEEQALYALQLQFALIIFSGKFYGLPIEQTTKDIKTGTPLSFYPRSELTLSIKRYLRRHYSAIEHPAKVIENFFEDPYTTCYAGIEFNPKGTTKNYLNLWQGIAIIPPKKGDWSGIEIFLFKIICNGNKVYYYYLIKYLAHAIQRPWEKPGVIIIMLGGQGIGKGTLAYILRMIWASAFLQVHDMSAVTGTFNASLEASLVVFLDEAFFVGDRRGSDRLKSLSTEPVLTINQKNQPMRQINSCHRFIIATNATHVKHTERDDRRDFTLRVSEAWKGQSDKWKALYQHIDNGGAEAMVHDLMHMDLSDFDVRQKPQTAELLNQKLQSLSPTEQWWQDKLMDGFFTVGTDSSLNDIQVSSGFIATETIINDIDSQPGRKPYKLPSAIDINQSLKAMCPSIEKVQKRVDGVKKRGFMLPEIEVCRSEFEAYIDGPIDWDTGRDLDEEDQMARPSSEEEDMDIY